jgi:hypothetical protein
MPPERREHIYASDTGRLVVLLSAFWWFASLVLMTLSLVLLHATWTGKERVLWIGKKTATQRGERHNPQRQPVQQSNIVVGYTGFFMGLMIIVILVFRKTVNLWMLSS